MDDQYGPCVIWSGSKHPKGYGLRRYNGKLQYAHRVAWIEKRGPIPANMQILHTCDTPSCIQNDGEGTYFANGKEHPRQGHLWLGTDSDNRVDMLDKARGPSGVRNGQHKLTEDVVRKARELYASGNYTQKQLAAMFGVSQTTMGDAVHGWTWQHVK